MFSGVVIFFTAISQYVGPKQIFKLKTASNVCACDITDDFFSSNQSQIWGIYYKMRDCGIATESFPSQIDVGIFSSLLAVRMSNCFCV
jgi:hypothetical protein